MAVLPTGAPLGQQPSPQQPMPPLPPPPGVSAAPPVADPRLDPRRAAMMRLLGGGA